jgi:hypothetical protein
MPTLIPTKVQWRKWSLPSKLTCVGAYLAILGILLSVVLSLWPASSTHNDDETYKAHSRGNQMAQTAVYSPNTVQIVGDKLGNVTINNASNIYTAPVTINASNNAFNCPVNLNINLSPDDKAQIIKLLQKIEKTRPTGPTTNCPGYSVVLVASLGKTADKRQKFIYDEGGLDRNRLSVYLGEDDILTFRVIDSASDAYSLRAPPGVFVFDQFAYFTFEVGNRGESSFLRILIDGEEVRTLELEHTLGLSNLHEVGSVLIGTDLERRHFGTFTMAAWFSWKRTLTAEQHLGVIKACSYLFPDIRVPNTDRPRKNPGD